MEQVVHSEEDFQRRRLAVLSGAADVQVVVTNGGSAVESEEKVKDEAEDGVEAHDETLELTAMEE